MSTPLAERCDGSRLRSGLSDASRWLASQATEINALNVFPVPDGDTGTNMSLTLQAAVQEAQTQREIGIGAVARAAAHGALLGARGNSGVILSQFLRGVARSLDKQADADGRAIAQALVQGSATADKAVIRPVEGTMLTVGRDAAQAAKARADEGGGLIHVLEAAVEAARTSVARTPQLLPILREAGVVDAGGQGLLCILEGLLASLRGEGELVGAEAGGQIRVAETAAKEYGYCTELLVRGRQLDLDSIRGRICELGDSALVVGESDLVRIHVHTFHPGKVLEYAQAHGTLHQIKIDNMQEQHQHVLAGGEAAVPDPRAHSPNGRGAAGGLAGGYQSASKPRTAVVAVAAGDGFAAILRSIGVSRVIRGGQTMNPSTEELLRAVEEAPSDEVILLPNNENILLAARQVQALTKKRVAVVPTRDLAQGVAAALAYSDAADVELAAKAMGRALEGVRTGEVTTAVRAAKLDGFSIRVGDYMGLVAGELAVVCSGLEEAVETVLGRLNADEAQLVTLYRGKDVSEAAAGRLLEKLRETHAGPELELVDGGQPLYHYVIAVE